MLIGNEFKNFYKSICARRIIVQKNKDTGYYEKLALDELAYHNKSFISYPILKLQQIFQKQLLFNIGNEELIEEAENVIANAKNLLATYTNIVY